MTTKLIITCPENSHWNLRLIAQDFTRTPEGALEGWADNKHIEPVVLKPGQTSDTLYVYDTRRYIIEEVPTTGITKAGEVISDDKVVGYRG